MFVPMAPRLDNFRLDGGKDDIERLDTVLLRRMGFVEVDLLAGSFRGQSLSIYLFRNNAGSYKLTHCLCIARQR